MRPLVGFALARGKCEGNGVARLGLCPILAFQGFYCGLYLVLGFHGLLV